ncbi:hypothetical protein BH09BAC1_BH09BAC1_31060 [soil metagenome]
MTEWRLRNYKQEETDYEEGDLLNYFGDGICVSACMFVEQ